VFKEQQRVMWVGKNSRQWNEWDRVSLEQLKQDMGDWKYLRIAF
jgi:hypothetical protein